MRKLATFFVLACSAVSASPAYAGPGACVQTLIAIQQAAHGGWLRGSVPALVRGVRGHNDVVLVQRKDGTYIVNEGAKFYSLPIKTPLGGKGQLLTSKTDGDVRKHSFMNTEAGRIVTPQGNEVDFHLLTVGEGHASILRARNDDEASLASAEDSVQRGATAADHLAKKSADELAICENGNEDRTGSLGAAIGDIIRNPGQASSAETAASKKENLKRAVDDFAAKKKASDAELAEIAKMKKQLAANDAALSSNKLALYDLPARDVDAALAEISAEFSDKMSDSTISDTDRAEIAKECGDGIKLPERKATAGEKIKASICDGMPPGQKQVCNLVLKGQ